MSASTENQEQNDPWSAGRLIALMVVTLSIALAIIYYISS